MNVTTRTTCPYCGVGCGVLARRDDSGAVTIGGDPDHPANRGRLCSKGSSLAETLDDRERLTQPLLGGKATSWSRALDAVAGGFARTIAEHGAGSVAFYVSGQLLTEDYYVVNKFVKGWLGTANIDTNSRLCMSSSVAGHRRAFGSDTVPGTYDDIEEADLLVLVGSNLAWCHPVLFQRLEAARARRPDLRVVLIDPRRTATAELADRHLAIAPGGDAALFGGLLAWLAGHGAVNEPWVERHTTGLAEALGAAGRHTLEESARLTGLSVPALEDFYRLFGGTEKVVTLFSQGVNQSESGTDTVNAIINCHLATGRIGRPGTGPLSITGQPNAMGGREVGGLANLLAAHLDLENADHRRTLQRFWGSPRIAERAGAKAVELFDAVEAGRIKALWIMGTNPVDSLPDAGRVERALAKCPLVIVSDVVVSSDTLRHATIALPAQAWGEKDGTVTNSERRISRQRAVRPPIGQARPDWWAVCEVAHRLGYGHGFSFRGPADIFREHAALSATDNDGSRDFDIGACAGLGDDDYDALTPFQWPWRRGQPRCDTRFFGDGGFYTADGRARFIAIREVEPRTRVSETWPMILNTGRVRDQWHTMTRTGLSPRLSMHYGEPFVEIHPVDAAAHGIGEADIVRVQSRHGSVLVRALCTERQRPGCLFAPMHWSDHYASQARINTLVSPVTDPVSGQPASKSEAVRVARWPAASHALLVLSGEACTDARAPAASAARPSSSSDPALRGTRDRPERPPTGRSRFAGVEYWARSTTERGEKFEMASLLEPAELFQRLRSCLPESGDERVTLSSPLQGEYRLATFREGHLVGALFVATGTVPVSRAWLDARFARPVTNSRDRHAVLAGRDCADTPDIGSVVCSCFGIGSRQIERARDDGACTSVAAIGEQLGAGTNCGSCRSEIRALLERPPSIPVRPEMQAAARYSIDPASDSSIAR